MRAWLVVLALLLAACNDSKPRPVADEVQRLCQLGDLPHATAAQRAELKYKAQVGIRAQTVAPTDRRGKAIFAAAFEITTTGVALPSDLPSPLATALAPSGSPYGLPTLEHALDDLAKACDQ